MSSLTSYYIERICAYRFYAARTLDLIILSDKNKVTSCCGIQFKDHMRTAQAVYLEEWKNAGGPKTGLLINRILDGFALLAFAYMEAFESEAYKRLLIIKEGASEDDAEKDKEAFSIISWWKKREKWNVPHHIKYPSSRSKHGQYYDFRNAIAHGNEKEIIRFSGKIKNRIGHPKTEPVRVLGPHVIPEECKKKAPVQLMDLMSEISTGTHVLAAYELGLENPAQRTPGKPADKRDKPKEKGIRIDSDVFFLTTDYCIECIRDLSSKLQDIGVTV